MHYKKILFLILIVFITFFESKAQSNSAVKDSQLVYAPARLQIDATLGLTSYPTYGLTYFLTSDLYRRNLFYVRFSNSRLIQIEKGIYCLNFCPTLSLGIIQKNFEAGLGVMAIDPYNSGFSHDTWAYFNLGLHSNLHKKSNVAWRFGVGIPEVFYFGLQVGLSPKKSKVIH